MADNERTLAALLALFADNQAGAISAQDLRDFLVTAFGGYASIYVEDGATPQTVNIAPAKLTGFAANGPSAGATPDHATDKITVGVTGTYWVGFNATIVGDNALYTFRLYTNGTDANRHATSAHLHAGADEQTGGFHGLVSYQAGDVVEIYAAAEANGKNLTLKHADLTLKRVG